MRILVTNDDGIFAPGLEILYQIACSLSDDVWVVAPLYEQSGASHSLSLRKPLRLKKYAERRFAIDGTPTDCVLIAKHDLLHTHPPDLVLSGVNAGSNLGEDVTYSGTVAAAMEGTLLNIRSIALSQMLCADRTIDWQTALHHGPALIQTLLEIPAEPHTLINVNFPACLPDAVQGYRVAPQGKRKIGDNFYKRLDPDGDPYYWIGSTRNQERDASNHSDFAVIAQNYISLTPIYMDLTHYHFLELLDEHMTREF